MWSQRLANVDATLDDREPKRTSRPTPDQSHWILPYSDIMDARSGEQWKMSHADSPADLARTAAVVIDRLTTVVLPAVEAHMSDEAIRDAFLDGDYSPLGSPVVYAYALVAALGPANRLPAALERLRESQPTAARALGVG